ncbi:MAG TPA: DNA primase [Sphingomonas sp.]|uniref:DNA primase n=1 Tax=Sphingomonas sp. TaxID=28214 RepID=UPI002CC800F0|nr:DNA primase [Sphingomonas sp.]HMI18490.1 DNA primase [Sphingomonas sp.]
MSLSPQFLDELRNRTLLSALIGRSVKLQKAGREFRACCPFHDEKTPSFYVNDDKGFYHCFGCSAHGDAIRFLTEAKGMPFIEAVKELVQAAGMDMPAPDPRSAERAERATGLVAASEAAQRWFAEQLQGIAGAEARAYLAKRGVPDELVKAFGLGFSPDSRGKLKTALATFGNETLIETGLLILVEEKEPYDRFRGRLMFPVRDARGRTIAFGGRILDSGEPKYLNSPDTPLFDKGRTLYNLDRAGPASRKAERVIVVEGYMDVIALAKAGVDEAVAPLGTALTEAQIERLWRLVPVPILCFDGDKAGVKAAVRAAMRALPMVGPGRSLSFVTLPGGQDPDDLVKAGGKAAVENALAGAIPLVDLLWNHTQAETPLDTPEMRAGLRRRLAELAQGIEDKGTAEQYKIEFRRRFDALFGAPQRQEQPFQPYDRGSRQPFRRDFRKPPPRPASERARSIGKTGIDRMMARAVIAGLVLRPTTVIAHAETLAGISLGDSVLERVRDTLIDAAFAGRSLEGDAAHSILAEAGLGPAVDELCRTNGLAFSFLRGDADPSRAERDLGEAIDVLVTRPVIEQALAEATRAFGTTTDEASFAEQQRLTREKQDVERRLMDLMQPDGD